MERLGYWTASIIAAVTAACCFLPLMFMLLGVGVAWMTILSPFVEYRVPILLLVSFGLGTMLVVLGVRRRSTGRRGLLLRPAGIVAIIFLALAWASPLWEDTVVEQLLVLLYGAD
ncbi:MAG: hypothetical protein R8L07_03185 [Alphaproteobacteria bacterium]|nr:hypothetical protein [Alphaproteobacteria bacterium]